MRSLPWPPLRLELSGELTPGEAQQLAHVVDTFVRALEAGALEERLRAVEAQAR